MGGFPTPSAAAIHGLAGCEPAPKPRPVTKPGNELWQLPVFQGLQLLAEAQDRHLGV